MSIEDYYLLWLDGFLKASKKEFDCFALEIAGNDLEGAQVSLRRFIRGIHGATETLKNLRNTALELKQLPEAIAPDDNTPTEIRLSGD